MGADVAGQLLVTAGQNADRLHSEPAFAMLCGVAPIPASSGRTNRHRLNRGGDRAANSALHLAILVRIRTDERTQAYVTRRTADGLSKLEIIRCLKRYLARENLSFPRRLRVALGRIGESEDDELAFAFHCSNDAPGVPFDHARCTAGYMGRAMGFYRLRHIERSMGMVLKSVGLPPRGRLSALGTKLAWTLLQRRLRKFTGAALPA